MIDIEVLNRFLGKQITSETEQAIKDRIIELDKLIKENISYREKLAAELKEKEMEYLKLDGAFESFCKLAITLEDLARSKVC